MLARQNVKMIINNIRNTEDYKTLLPESRDRIELVFESALEKVSSNGRLLPSDQETSKLLKLSGKFLKI